MDQDQKKKEAVLHGEHRQRIKERYASTGFDGFSPHEVLEMLLFYAIPRKDVNPIAHRLINRFGSLSGVLDAPVEQIEAVEGMGPTSAQFLKLFPEVARLYLIDRQCSTQALTNFSKIREYLQPHFVGLTKERMMLVLLDHGMHPLCCTCVAEGSASSLKASYRTMAELIIKYQATAAILAHNHPGGVPFPSEADKSLTLSAIQLLDALNVSLVDHFVLTDTTCVPMMMQDNGLFHAYRSDVFGRDFRNSFYQPHEEEKKHDPAMMKNTILDAFDNAKDKDKDNKEDS